MGVDAAGRLYGATVRERILHGSEVSPTGCWEWRRSKTADGYGVIKIGGRTRRAHVVSYEESNGPVPDGIQLDHLCRVRHCVNPDHLEPVSHLDNVRRGIVGDQGRRGTCKRGHSLAEFGERRVSRGRETTGCGQCRRDRQNRYYAEGRPHRGSRPRV